MSDTTNAGNVKDGYDIFAGDYANDPDALWAAMRKGGCPVAHSDKWGGSWVVTRYDDVRDIAHDGARFSSRAVEVAGPIPEIGHELFLPPLTSSPDDHKAHRDLLAPFFTPAKIAELEPFVRDEARRLATAIAERGEGDAVGDFARPLALSVISHILKVPLDAQNRFVDWVVRLVRLGPLDQKVRSAVVQEKLAYLEKLLEERASAPGDDLISYLAHATLNGEPLSRKHKLGSLFLLVLAGADTTWSAMGASLWHLASHADDRAQLLAQPDMMRTTAVEELLRAYAPVSIARLTAEPVELHGRCIAAQERVILPLAAANRDPAVFDEPDTVKLDRKRNRHLTFSSGEHRCLGSNVARLELRVALEEWLRVMPNFHLTAPDAVEWTAGQTRGPEQVLIAVDR
ncbi:cytochrome P450 [Paraburkholderia fungorum]|jgi:cytochrome P450|uniref:cytochrome P450 n=1 Tax=Paraburkholderia fungorum TaxID=134537 RepID=UPI001C1E9AF2|nr:cytochrome P450 [Paraburkholderia fungorum]MBU7437861.1 cytochrome P450 [Paraburkholderia fungorum]